MPLEVSAVIVRERGPTPRKLQKAMTAAKRVAWRESAEFFHDQFFDDRFTKEHARKAGYYLRKGEGMVPGSKAFNRSYTGRKLRMFGHTNPLEFSGETRANAKASARAESTSQLGRIIYPGARKFNFQHEKSRINMAEEFRRVLPDEANATGRHFDQTIDRELNKGS